MFMIISALFNLRIVVSRVEPHMDLEGQEAGLGYLAQPVSELKPWQFDLR